MAEKYLVSVGEDETGKISATIMIEDWGFKVVPVKSNDYEEATKEVGAEYPPPRDLYSRVKKLRQKLRDGAGLKIG